MKRFATRDATRTTHSVPFKKKSIPVHLPLHHFTCF
jgi:hypothetical protein